MKAINQRSTEGGVLLTGTAFIGGGRSWTWGDVVSAACLWGDWLGVEQRSSAAATALDEARRDGSAPSEQKVHQGMLDFRYRQDLLAGSELEEWLASWGMTDDDVIGYVERELVFAQCSQGKSTDHARRDQVQTPTSIALIDAVCSGDLERLARKLARAVASAIALEHALPAGELSANDIERLDDDLEEWAQAAATDRAIDHAILSHSLDWTTLRYRRVEHPDRPVIDEIALCVVHDSADLAEIVTKADARLEVQTVRIGELESPLAQVLVSANPGQTVGPLPLESGSFLFVEVVERNPPDPKDERLRAMAAAELKRIRVDGAVRDHITWPNRGPSDESL